MANQHDSGHGAVATPTRDDVARRAFEIFQARGGEPGYELENWLQAERELALSASDGNEQSEQPQSDRDR